MTTQHVDAVVIGAGHNGLVAAGLLAEKGWDVLVLDAADQPGGAIASIPADSVQAGSPLGYVTDLFSAFHPMAAASPVMQRLDLPAHGLSWARSPSVVGHPPSRTADRAAVLHADPADTAAGLDADQDGETWMRLVDQYRLLREPLLDALMQPLPPVRALGRLAARLGVADGLHLARMLLLPAHRLGEELFRGQDARLLLSGNAMHADVPPNAPGSGLFGWLMCMLGQDLGFPTPRGGTSALAHALAAAATSAGAVIQSATPVTQVMVSDGRATGVRTASGDAVLSRRAVVADVAAPALYGQLLAESELPARLRSDLDRFDWDLPTVKVNWALRGRIAWNAPELGATACVHLGADDNELVRWAADLGSGRLPQHPFMLLGQMAVADPARAPEGMDSVWAYSHLPRNWGTRSGVVAQRQVDALTERMTTTIEKHAPGFTDLIADTYVQAPRDLESADANLAGGTINGGTAQLHQQLIFRPVPGLGRPETVIPGLYLASAATHPGGAVHGGAGAAAARVALRDARWRRVPGRAISSVSRRLYTGARIPWPGD